MYVVQPPTDAVEAQIRRQKLLGLEIVDQTDGIEELHPTEFALQRPWMKTSANLT
jgi:hypothetical protein